MELIVCITRHFQKSKKGRIWNKIVVGNNELFQKVLIYRDIHKYIKFYQAVSYVHRRIIILLLLKGTEHLLDALYQYYFTVFE